MPIGHLPPDGGWRRHAPKRRPAPRASGAQPSAPSRRARRSSGPKARPPTSTGTPSACAAWTDRSAPLKDQLVQAWGGPYQGTKTIRGEDWVPYQRANFVTPSFSEYLSGHSTFSAAAALLLKAATGSDTFGMSETIAAGSFRIEAGTVPAAPVTRSWKSFTAAADQAGISRGVWRDPLQ
jgi:hypothetical protein